MRVTWHRKCNASSIRAASPNVRSMFLLQTTNREVAWSDELYDSNPAWLRMDVTLRSVEETAARILREVSKRYGDEHPLMRP